MYVNLASAAKLARATQIVAQLGEGAYLQLYSGIAPLSPDLSANGTLLASLPLASGLATATLAVERGAIMTAGQTGTNGGHALTITGDGVGATGFFVVAGQRLTDITIIDGGYGYSAPPVLGGFEAAGLSGATAEAVMTARIIFPTILPAVAVDDGVVGYARLTQADQITSVLDLDVGLTNEYAVVMSSIALLTGQTVSCDPPLLIDDGPPTDYGHPRPTSIGGSLRLGGGQRKARIATHTARPIARARLIVR